MSIVHHPAPKLKNTFHFKSKIISFILLIKVFKKIQKPKRKTKKKGK
jgi:hypothetical protein